MGGKKYTGTTYAEAEAFLAGGKAKTSRPTSKNVYLARQYDGSISVVLHSTAIITYHEDTTFTLYHGGWNTVTTKAKLSEFSPIRISSTYDRKNPGWSLGTTGEFTPAKVQKCRSCKGTGGDVSRRTCEGAPWYSWRQNENTVTCDGPTTAHRVERVSKWTSPPGEDNFDEYYASAYQVPCEHGEAFTARHRLTLCEHGNRERHQYGEIETHECWGCKGTGMRDYGSKPIHIVWTSGAVRMDADRKVLDMDADRYDAPGKYSASYSKPASWYAQSEPVVKHSFGSQTNSVLEKLLPGMRDTATCPACKGGDAHTNPITSMVIHLNDSKRWTREAIADWLETLDADLRFPVAIGA